MWRRRFCGSYRTLRSTQTAYSRSQHQHRHSSSPVSSTPLAAGDAAASALPATPAPRPGVQLRRTYLTWPRIRPAPHPSCMQQQPDTAACCGICGPITSELSLSNRIRLSKLRLTLLYCTLPADLPRRWPYLEVVQAGAPGRRIRQYREVLQGYRQRDWQRRESSKPDAGTGAQPRSNAPTPHPHHPGPTHLRHIRKLREV